MSVVEWTMRMVIFSALVAASTVSGKTLKEGYDPLRESPGIRVEQKDVEFVDKTRDRDIPLRVSWNPAEKKPVPVVLFSHGLGGSRENNAYVAEHWAARGYVVVAMQHAGSDERVWKEVRGVERLTALKKAASAENAVARFLDVPAVLDQLERWHGEDGHFLEGRLDLGKVGMSGHSFGAVTTQGVSGQVMPGRGTKYTDKRIDAALPMSPSVPPVGTPERAFEKVEIPWLLMTGTKDHSPIGRSTVEDRQRVYPALPPGDKYELLLKDAEHMAFSDRTLRGREHRNPNHHKAIIALSTAFWDAHLKGNNAARLWLQGGGAKGVLEKDDRWQWK
jgi:predicted dienelactone hydrolase